MTNRWRLIGARWVAQMFAVHPTRRYLSGLKGAHGGGDGSLPHLRSLIPGQALGPGSTNPIAGVGQPHPRFPTDGVRSLRTSRWSPCPRSAPPTRRSGAPSDAPSIMPWRMDRLVSSIRLAVTKVCAEAMFTVRITVARSPTEESMSEGAARQSKHSIRLAGTQASDRVKKPYETIPADTQRLQGSMPAI
jgi:hypothetical protein